MKTVRVTGKTVEEAVAEGLSQLGISREAAIVHVVEEPSGGLFGLLRRKQAVVDVSCMDGESADRAFLDELAQEGREAAAKAIAENAAAVQAAPEEAPAPEAPAAEAPQAEEAAPAEAPAAEAETEAAPAEEPASEAAEEETEAPAEEETETAAPRRSEAPFSQEEQNATAEEAKKFLAGVFKGMGLEVAMEKMTNEERILLNLRGKGLGILIGKHGQTLNALQYLTNLAAGRLYHHRYFVVLDVENYRARREQTLTALARRLADKAKRTGLPVELEPMEPGERRIIHLALQNDPDVVTDSEGEGSYRHVVIHGK